MHRWTLGPVGGPATRRGHWHATRKEALDAAVKAGLASRDEHSGKVYLGVLVEVEERAYRRSHSGACRHTSGGV